MTGKFISQVLPASMPSLAGGTPKAPPGTIFVKTAQGGLAVPRRKFTVHFGRDGLDVHVAIGTSDSYVSRLHGIFTCDGNQWQLRNEGRRPIQLPGGDLLLRGHEHTMTAGYTPLIIETPNHRHLIEAHIVGALHAMKDDQIFEESTSDADAYHLSPVERLVATALAQRYLRQEHYPQPVSWKQVADDLQHAAPQRSWTAKGAEHTVARVRERLSKGLHPVPGLLAEDGIGHPLGNTLNHNLIQELLKSATLSPEDLYVLGEEESAAGSQ